MARPTTPDRPGAKPTDCHPQERTITARRLNRVARMYELYEYRTRSRDYLVLSLATHDRGKTTWHRLVVWNADRMGGRGAVLRVR
jgi:hypothetical protein